MRPATGPRTFGESVAILTVPRRRLPSGVLRWRTPSSDLVVWRRHTGAPESAAPNPFGSTTTGRDTKPPDVIDRNRRGSSASKTSGCRETTRSGGSGSEPGPGDITGVVLAGGHSRRFGDRDKALARLGDRTLLARVVGRLGAAVDSVVVNCRGDQRAAIAEALDLPVDSKSEADVRVRFAVDPVPDRGPLFGFRTALQTVETGTCALAACDTPFLDSHLVADLADRLTADPAAEAVAVAIGDRGASDAGGLSDCTGTRGLRRAARHR